MLNPTFQNRTLAVSLTTVNWQQMTQRNPKTTQQVNTIIWIINQISLERDHIPVLERCQMLLP